MAPLGPAARVEDRDVIGFANKRVASSGPPAVRSFASTREGREERQQLQAQRGRAWYSHTSSNGSHRRREAMPVKPSSSGRGTGGGPRAYNPPSGPRRDREVSSFSGGGDSWVSTEREEEYEPRDRDRASGRGTGGGLPPRPNFEQFGSGPREGEAGPSTWNQGGDRGGRMHRVYSPSQPARNSERSYSPVQQPNFSTQNWQPTHMTHGHQPVQTPSAPTPSAIRPISTHTHFSPHSSTLPTPADRSYPTEARPPPVPAEPIRPTSSSLPALAMEQIPLAGPAQTARQAMQTAITSRESTPTIPTAKLKFKPTKKARVPSGPEPSTQNDISEFRTSLAGQSKVMTRKDELEEEVDTKPTMEELNAYEPVEIKIQRTGTLALMKKDIPKSCFSVPGKDRVLARQEFKAIHFAKLRAQGKTPKHAMWRDDGFAIDWVREDMEPSPPPAPVSKQLRGNKASGLAPNAKPASKVPPATTASKAVSPRPAVIPPNVRDSREPTNSVPPIQPSRAPPEAASTSKGGPPIKPVKQLSSAISTPLSVPSSRLESASNPSRQANPFESWPAPAQTQTHPAVPSSSPQTSMRSDSLALALAPEHTDQWISGSRHSSSNVDAPTLDSSQSTWIRYFPIPDELRSEDPSEKISVFFNDWRRKRAREACEIDAKGLATLRVEPLGRSTDLEMYRFRIRRFLPGESRELPRWLKMREGEDDELASSPVKEENGHLDRRPDNGQKVKEKKRKSELEPELTEGKKKKLHKVEEGNEGKKHKEGRTKGEKKKHKAQEVANSIKPKGGNDNASTATPQPPPTRGTATSAFPRSSTPISSFAAFGPASSNDKPSIPLTPGPSLFNPLPTDIKPTSTSVTSSATLNQLEEKLFTNLESIDKWTQMMADYPSRGEYLQKQVERVQQDIFKIQEEIRRRKGGK